MLPHKHTGLPADATERDVKKAFRRLALQHHVSEERVRVLIS
jgi:DnaJ-class molecular chaperone